MSDNLLMQSVLDRLAKLETSLEGIHATVSAIKGRESLMGAFIGIGATLAGVWLTK